MRVVCRVVSCAVVGACRVGKKKGRKEGACEYRGHEGGVDVLGRLFNRVHGTLLHGIGEQVPGWPRAQRWAMTSASHIKKSESEKRMKAR